jgi:hypothetical protein
MRGGAQAHLMRCSDGHFYVVKFQNNPQHLRVLANEMLATRLAQEIGLSVPAAQVVEVSDWLIENTPELRIQLANTSIQCQCGIQFGSRYVVDPTQGQVFDYIPVEMLNRVRNLEQFAGALAFDKWTGNADGRQAAFWRYPRERKYTVAFIDHGYCFNGGDWGFPDQPLRGVYAKNEVYADIAGWESFEPWLTRIEDLSENRIWEIGAAVPTEWYLNESNEFQTLISALLMRRTDVRSLIHSFRQSVRRPFPRWPAAA